MQEPRNQPSAELDGPDTHVMIAPEQPSPVFVDSTGRRSRLLRRTAYGFVVVCMVYGGLVSVSLAGGPVSTNAILPLIADGGPESGTNLAQPTPIPAPATKSPSPTPKATVIDASTPRRFGPTRTLEHAVAPKPPVTKPKKSTAPPKTTPPTTKPTSRPVESATTTPPASATPSTPATTPPTTKAAPAPKPPAATTGTGGTGGGEEMVDEPTASIDTPSTDDLSEDFPEPTPAPSDSDGTEEAA